MNRYYNVIRELYKKNRRKRKLKHIYGKKYKWVLSSLFGVGIGSAGLLISCFMMLSMKYKIYSAYVFGISYVVIIFFAILGMLVSKKSKLDERSRWTKEIEDFEKLIDAYKFNSESIEFI